jgi:ankyrin repeat protein
VTYDRILERVNERGDSACILVERILCWLSNPHSVLSVRQLCEAIAVEPGSTSLDTRDVVDVQDIFVHCSSLVRLSADGKIVEFAHFTVGEYLREIDSTRRPHLKRYRWDSSSANTYKAETCLTALRFEVLNRDGAYDMPSLLSQLFWFPFLLHAAEGWNHYLERGHSSEALNALTSQLLCTPDQDNFVNWRHLFVLSKTKTRTALWAACQNAFAPALQDGATVLEPSITEDDWNDHQHDWIVAQAIGQSSTELHFAAMFHLNHLIKPLAASMPHINSQSSMGTPLHCALLGVTAVHCALETSLKFQAIKDRTAKHRKGLATAVRSLLDVGADVQIDCRPLARSRSTTAFIAYSVGELETMVAAGAVLDEITADLILKEESLDRFTYLRGMDISKVADSDRFTVVRLLRQLRNPQDGLISSIPANTAASIFTDGQQKLIDKYQEALDHACRNDDLETSEWIFEGSGSQVDQVFKGNTFLHIASEDSSLAIVEYLLGKGADVNKLNGDASTALGCLLSVDNFDRCSLRVLNTLLAAGASVREVACAAGHSLIVWADLQLQRDEDGDSHTEVLGEAVQALLSYGADPLSQDQDQDNVWHQLARNTHGHVLAELIMPHLSDTVIRDSIDARNNHAYTPLLLAASYSDRVRMMRLLMSRGADPKARTSRGRTMLDMAMISLRGSDEPFKLAIGVVADEDDVDRVCSNALEAFTRATCRDHHAISSDTPSYLRDALDSIMEHMSIQLLREVVDSKCAVVLVKWLAEYGYHNLERCDACAVRLDCFQIFFQLLYDGKPLDEANFDCFGILADGFRTQSEKVADLGANNAACIKAICNFLELAIPTEVLKGLLEASSFVPTVARLNNLCLLDSLLAAVNDVDLVTNGVSLLAWLCYWAVPESILAKAAARSNKLDDDSGHGFCLIHKPFEAFAQDDITVHEVETVVRVLIESGVNVNAVTTPGRSTALIKSATLPSSATLELLLRNGADVTLCDQVGGNALIEACFSRREDCVRILIERGCPFVYQEKWWHFKGETETYLFGPFQAAAQSGSLEVLHVLFDLSQLDTDRIGRPNAPSPLWLACSLSDNTKSVNFLLEQGLDANYIGPEDGKTPLHLAAMMGNLSNIQVLLQAGANPNALDHGGHSPEMRAIMQGHALAAGMIVEHNTSNTRNTDVIARDTMLPKIPDSQQSLSDKIRDLVSWSEVGILRKLTAHGVDLNLPYQSCHCTPLATAIATGKTSVATYLLSLRTVRIEKVCERHLPEYHSMLASLAAQDGMIEPLQKALELHSPLSAQTWECMLQSAVAAGNAAGLELLLSEQVKPDLTSWCNHSFLVDVHILDDNVWSYEQRYNGTALHTAVAFRQHTSISVLLKHGFDLERLDHDGNTPLHIAAYRGCTRSVGLLHSHGCNLEARSVPMETALQTACRRGELNVVDLLLNLGADFEVVDWSGQDILGSASANGQSHVSLMLIRAGLVPSFRDICDIYRHVYRSVLSLEEVIKTLGKIGSLSHVCNTPTKRDVGMSRAFLMRPFLKRHPPHLLKLGLTAHREGCATPLYTMARSDAVQVVELLQRSGAMLNLEGGTEGTPLMGACKAGRLEVVKYLVRNGAVLSYTKYGAVVSALKKAASFPLILRWLLVGRFTDQRMVTFDGLTNGVAAEADECDDDEDDSADVTLDLIFEEVLEQYLESRNWFIPKRRFVDNGDGAFYRVPIVPSEFGRYRPPGFEILVR